MTECYMRFHFYCSSDATAAVPQQQCHSSSARAAVLEQQCYNSGATAVVLHGQKKRDTIRKKHHSSLSKIICLKCLTIFADIL